MPIEIINSLIFNGPESIPKYESLKRYGIPLFVLGILKYYFKGKSNTWERHMHGHVVIITGGTSGIGEEIVNELAYKKAQIILLVKNVLDSWLIEKIEELREKSQNLMIYAEECDLGSLHSIRKFATKWLDNQTPRRLDAIICCASELVLKGSPKEFTSDKVEKQIGINYLGHYHLIDLLSPSIRSQPPDRDVRICIATCSSHVMGEIDMSDLLWENKPYPENKPWYVYGTSKLLLGLFVKEYQRQINNYIRNDKLPCNVKINLINPGITRTPSMRRFLSIGTIIGLIIYIMLYPIMFTFIKNSNQGAQSFFFCLFSPLILKSKGGEWIQNCKFKKEKKKEYNDHELQKKVFNETAKLLKVIEKNSVIERKKKEMRDKKKKKDSKDTSNNLEKSFTSYPTLNKNFLNASKTFADKLKDLEKKG